MENELFPTRVCPHFQLTSAVSTPPRQSTLPYPSIQLRCSAPASTRLSLSILRRAYSSRADAAPSDCCDKTLRLCRTVKRFRLLPGPGSRGPLFHGRLALHATSRPVT